MGDLVTFFMSDEVQRHLSAFLLGSVRIIAFASFAPFLGPQLTVAVMAPIIFSLYLPLHPWMVSLASPLGFGGFIDLIELLVLIGKEFLIGYILAYVCATVFYIALSAGVVIDNQRGASMAQESDPLSGGEGSPLGTVMFLAMVTLFFASGAFSHFLEVFYTTYTLWSPFEYLPALLHSNVSIFSIDALSYFMKNMLLVCAPFIIVALLCDVALGLMNRFAPQLNVFILSMPIKSGICALLIIFYMGPFLDHSQDLFLHIDEAFSLLGQILGVSVSAN